MTLWSFESVSLVEYAANMKSLSHVVQKLWPRLKFFYHRHTDREDKTRSPLNSIPGA